MRRPIRRRADGQDKAAPGEPPRPRLRRHLDMQGIDEARLSGDPVDLVSRKLMLQDLDLMVERKGEPPSQILGGDCLLGAVRAAIKAALAPARQLVYGLA